MPKIIYRPFPGPPPFPPPGPSYDTHYYAQSPNQVYSPENPLGIKFSPCSYPEFDYIEIVIGGERIAIYSNSVLPFEDFYFLETEGEGAVPFQGIITFNRLVPDEPDVTIYSAPISVTYAE